MNKLFEIMFKIYSCSLYNVHTYIPISGCCIVQCYFIGHTSTNQDINLVNNKPSNMFTVI